MTLYLGYALLGFLCGYALCHSRRRTHRLPRHLDPAIVDREGDDGIQPPDPRTWTATVTHPVTQFVHPRLGVAELRESWDPKAVPEPKAPPAPAATWPDTLEHDYTRKPHVFGSWSVGCPRCEADRWLRSGARPA